MALICFDFPSPHRFSNRPPEFVPEFVGVTSGFGPYRICRINRSNGQTLNGIRIFIIRDTIQTSSVLGGPPSDLDSELLRAWMPVRLPPPLPHRPRDARGARRLDPRVLLLAAAVASVAAPPTPPASGPRPGGGGRHCGPALVPPRPGRGAVRGAAAGTAWKRSRPAWSAAAKRPLPRAPIFPESTAGLTSWRGSAGSNACSTASTRVRPIVS